MEAIIFCLFGVFIGYAICALFSINKLNDAEREIAYQRKIIKNRDLLINRIKTILNSNEIFTEKYNKIKELFPETKQEK